VLVSSFCAVLFACASEAAMAAPTCQQAIPLNTSGPRPTVMMTVANGKGGKAVFDTGSMGTIVDVGFAQTAGLANEGPVGPPYDRMPFPNKYASTLHGLRLGGILIGDTRVPVLPAPEPGIAAVLSPQLFSGRLIEVDLGKRKLRVCSRSDARQLGPGTPYSSGPFSLPAISVRIGKTTLPAHIDTGSPFALSFPLEYARQFSLIAPMVKIGTGRSHNGEGDIFSAVIRGEVQIGPLTLTNPKVIFTDIIPNPNVGSELLRQMVVIIDPDAKRSWTRASKQQVAPPTAHR
jgi:hypothetical protein